MEQWAKRTLGIAKSKHMEISNGKGLSDMDLQLLENLKSKLTIACSKDSEIGQAASIIIGLCADFFYQCLAFGYDIRLSSDTLESSIAQATEDMVAKQKRRQHRGKKLQLSQLPDKVKSMQPDRQKQAQSR